jgi:hypothetical protein
MSTQVRTPAAEVRSAPRWAMTLPQVWAAISCALPMMVVLGSLGAIDLAYHLRAGDLMIRTHSFLRSDPLSFTAGGGSWVDQQWGAQLLLAWVFKGLGWGGLALAHGLLVGAIFAFVYLACRAAGSPARISAWTSLAAFVAAFVNLSLRPQLLGMALFAVTLWLVVGRTSHPGRLVAVPAIVAIWANVHGSFFLGPLLIALAWVEDVSRNDPRARRTLLLGVASAAATLLNPFGPRVWSYVIKLSTNSDITAHVQEWQPPTLRGPGGTLFFLSVAVVAVLLARTEQRVPWPRILWLGAFFVIGLTAGRSTAWWALGAAPLIANLLGDRVRIRKELPASTLNSAIAFLLVVPCVLLFPWSFVGTQAGAPGSRVANAPAAISSELHKVLRPGDRIFNAQIWGSWFEFAIPDNPVFVDSRIEVFSHSIWRQYMAVSGGRQGWQAILDRWRVRAVAISPEQQAGLIPLIRRDPTWDLVYMDKDGLIFLRR